MLDLNNIELVCIDTLPKFDISLLAIEHSIKNINFEKITFFSTKEIIQNINPHLYNINDEQIKIEMIDVIIKNIYEYSYFITHNLYKYLTFKYVLLIQWDGFVLNPNQWVNDFLDYDYIGAKWETGICGNGGFSFRSKKLFKTIYNNIDEFDLNIKTNIKNPIDEEFKDNEDVQICRINRNLLENKNIKFCQNELMDKFSVENGQYTDQFGFHGTNENLPNWVIDMKLNRY